MASVSFQELIPTSSGSAVLHPSVGQYAPSFSPWHMYFPNPGSADPMLSSAVAGVMQKAIINNIVDGMRYLLSILLILIACLPEYGFPRLFTDIPRMDLRATTAGRLAVIVVTVDRIVNT